MLHVDTGGDNDRSRYFFDALKQRQVPYDWIGLSFYPYWHGAMADLKANMADLAARYNKPVIVAEMAYGFTTDYAGNTKNIFDDAQAERAGYPATEQGQAAVVRDIIAAVQRVPNQKGLGVFYWEPGWIMTDEGTNNYVTANNGWKNQALFDYAGNMLSGMRVLGHYVVPEQLLAQAKQQLAIGFAKGDRASSVTTNLRLPAKAANGATVTWRSSNPTVVSAAGRVTRPAKGRKSVLVSLTAVLKLGKSVDVKTFGILVKAR
jgi:arabinogalactan endo-1,4-beta-galactosidase